MRGSWVVVLTSVASGLACSGLPVLSPSVDPHAEAVAAAWMAGELPDDPSCDEGLPWVVVARRGASEQRVAAYEVLRGCSMDERVGAAAAGVGDADPAVAGAALRLAGDLFGADEGNEALADAVAATLAHHASNAVRYEAVEALDRFPWTSSPPLEAAMLAALGDDFPPLVSEVFARATARSAGLSDPDPWSATARFALQAHLDPGIRGRAGLLLARLVPTQPTTRQLLRAGLNDRHPHARSQAAAALGVLQDLGAASLIVRHIDDEEPNGWVMRPWKDTTGRERRQIHVGSHFERVDDAMLRALVDLSAPMGEEGFQLREMSLRYLQLDLIAARRDALRWVAAHQDALDAVAE